MTDIQTRPFSKNYSGLINQSVIAVGIAVLCVTSQELMKRKRRGSKEKRSQELGSRESWEFGYLYQGRCWAKWVSLHSRLLSDTRCGLPRTYASSLAVFASYGACERLFLGMIAQIPNPSPPSPKGWPLSWVKQVIKFPESKMLELRGIDATLYVRFLRGCLWWALLQTATAFPILFAIHVHFSDDTVSPKSMTRASISSLVITKEGRDLLWIHMCFMFWLTLTWMCNLLWVCHGAFRMRAVKIDAAVQRVAERPENGDGESGGGQHYPHPHPQFAFRDITTFDPAKCPPGLQSRTVMVSNLPPPLRSEKELKNYFQHYLSRKVDKPTIGINSATQPGFLNKTFAFLFNRAKRLPAHIQTPAIMTAITGGQQAAVAKEVHAHEEGEQSVTPEIERVVIVRKLSELASLLERREDILRRLETAHVKLAKKTLTAVCDAMRRQREHLPLFHKSSTAATIAKARSQQSATDVERGIPDPNDEVAGEQCMKELIRVLSPYVADFDLEPSLSMTSKIAETKKAFQKLRQHGSESSSDGTETEPQSYPPCSTTDDRPKPTGTSGMTIWEALLSLPRSSLDAYQPLINLSTFRNRLVPAIDYYTLKLNFLCSLIVEERARATADHVPASTAFVTFADPRDARKACQYLAVHPNNPLACMVSMAPSYDDLDWSRLMKLSYSTEFVKDWVVNVGVWGFTIFWLFPVSLLVGLVSIQNISTFWPALRDYLDHHQWEEELIQSFLPTLLVALLAILIPLILLLIAKKANTLTSLSALHDRIMTRYYKFLVVNVLVFFCVGTVALQSLLTSIKTTTSRNILNIVATSFPSAGPFYAGWLIFTTAMHAGFELALLGLPLILYPSTRSQVTPRKRTTGIRPRTFNFYYWLPNHLLIIHVLLVFLVLNPFVLPFGTLYFFIESGIIKNQLIHVYAKNYEQNGHNILIRIVRYSLDGAMLSQVVFLAYMVVLEKSVNVGLTAFLIVFTSIVKIVLTRICRYQFEVDDIKEAEVLCGLAPIDQTENVIDAGGANAEGGSNDGEHDAPSNFLLSRRHTRLSTLWSGHFPAWASISNISYATLHRRPHYPDRRKANPFRPQRDPSHQFSRLGSVSIRKGENGRRQSDSDKDYKAPPLHTQNSDGSAISSVLLSPQIADTTPAISLTRPSPVTPHPPPIPWDDNRIMELPYDNPYYTRAITNALWLPRNPFGILDLDDTVDLDASIVTTSSKGELGQWMGDTVASASPAVTPETHAPVLMQRTYTRSTRTLQPYTGDEEIELPPVIRERVNSEKDVEHVVPYRSKGRQYSFASGGGPPSSMRRPSTLAPRISFRSFSAGEPQRDRTSSLMSGFTHISLDRARSADHEIGMRTTSLLVPSELGSTPSTNGSPSRPPLTRAHNISAHEAIVHEVLAEQEQVEADEREEERLQRQKAQSNRSWFVSWMFKKAKDSD